MNVFRASAFFLNPGHIFEVLLKKLLLSWRTAAVSRFYWFDLLSFSRLFAVWLPWSSGSLSDGQGGVWLRAFHGCWNELTVFGGGWGVGVALLIPSDELCGSGWGGVMAAAWRPKARFFICSLQQKHSCGVNALPLRRQTSSQQLWLLACHVSTGVCVCVCVWNGRLYLWWSEAGAQMRRWAFAF